MAFDRLIYIDRLKQAGMDEGMARAHAGAVRDALLETVATKADLADVRSELKAEIAEARGEIRELRSEMHSEFKALRTEMQLMSRDLMVKGVTALAVVTSLLVSTKFFG